MNAPFLYLMQFNFLKIVMMAKERTGGMALVLYAAEIIVILV